MIYLDSAATSLQKPPAVARACSYAISHYASPGRGGHKPAMDAAAAAFACREAAAHLFQVPKCIRDSQQCHPRPEYRHKGPGPSGRDSGHLRI